MSVFSKVIDVVQKDGIFVLFTKSINNIKIKTLPYFDYWFDLKYGVDTCQAMFHNEASDIGSNNKRTAIRYEATPVKAVRSILKKLPVKHSEYTFIDYGSGKGRVLLLASEFPFKNIIGVELSKRLHEIAEKNIKICKHLNHKCINIESFCADAAQFELPNNPLVIFFFTPFLGLVMDRVIANIQGNWMANPRPIHIVYYGSRIDIIKILSNMNVTHQLIFSKHLLSASGKYKGHLFSFRASAKENCEVIELEGQPN